MIRCSGCGQESVGETAAGGSVLLALHDGALEARAAGGPREAVIESDGRSPDMLLGDDSVEVPVGARIQMGSYALLIERRSATVPRQRHDSAEALAALEKDEAAALDAMAVAEGGFGGPYASAVIAVADAVRAHSAAGRPLGEDGHAGRLAVITLVEGIGDEMAGPGRTVRLPRGARTTPAAMVGAGPNVFLALSLPSGPEAIVLNRDGFSFVSEVTCRRLTTATRGVEWRYTDPAPQAGFDLSVKRMVGAVPAGVNRLLEEAWQHRVLAMTSRPA